MDKQQDCAWDGPKAAEVLKLIDEARGAKFRQKTSMGQRVTRQPDAD